MYMRQTALYTMCTLSIFSISEHNSMKFHYTLDKISLPEVMQNTIAYSKWQSGKISISSPVSTNGAAILSESMAIPMPLKHMDFSKPMELDLRTNSGNPLHEAPSFERDQGFTSRSLLIC